MGVKELRLAEFATLNLDHLKYCSFADRSPAMNTDGTVGRLWDKVTCEQ
jgi:hypothetical protein